MHLTVLYPVRHVIGKREQRRRKNMLNGENGKG